MSSFDIWLDNYKIGYNGKDSEMNKKGMEAAHHAGFSKARDLRENAFNVLMTENRELKDTLIDVLESVNSVRATIEK